MVFKNVGAAAGASIEHTHSQLIVTPIVPISVWEEMTGLFRAADWRRLLNGAGFRVSSELETGAAGRTLFIGHRPVE
jgi:hypothetical protein